MSDCNKRIFIIGATGLIGRQVVTDLLENGLRPVVLSRNLSKAKKQFGDGVEIKSWNGEDVDALRFNIDRAKAIINLAGESIASRWTAKKKDSILKSRIITTNAVVLAIAKCDVPPEVYVQASAIGYYPHNQGLQFDEDGPLGSGFLSQVVMQWESAALKVENRSRLIIIRTGVVLSSEGGFLSKMALPIKLYIGGWFGSGDQYISWIHIKDHVRAISFLIKNSSSKGIYNLVSPEPVNVRTFVKRIGFIQKKPVWLPIPSFILKLVFGQMAGEVILSNQSIIPKRLMQAVFEFKFKNLDDALKDLLNKKQEI